MADSVFHKDFKAMPWWWEWWHPTNELSQDPPRKTDVLVVGAGYGGLSTALELARSGVDVTVLERGDFGVGASTRNGGGVSGGTTIGKGFSGKGVGGDPEAWKKIMPRMLADAADSLAQVETVIEREGIECHWRMNGRFSGAYTPRHYSRAGGQGRHLQRERRRSAPTWCRASASARRSRRTTTTAAWWWSAPASSIRRSTTGACSKAAHRAGATLCANAMPRSIERKIGGGLRVLTSKGPIEAREVVIATNGYTGELTPTLKRRLVPVASHIIATEELPRGSGAAA